jgi:hypothetical protein
VTRLLDESKKLKQDVIDVYLSMHIYPQQSRKPDKTLLGSWNPHLKTRNQPNFLKCTFPNEASAKEIMGSV